MHDANRMREARMMEAIAGLGGRSAPSAEVDLRLGVLPRARALPGWVGTVARLLRRAGRPRSVPERPSSSQTRPLRTTK